MIPAVRIHVSLSMGVMMNKDTWDVCAICGDLKEKGVTFNSDVKAYTDIAYIDIFICNECIDKMFLMADFSEGAV